MLLENRPGQIFFYPPIPANELLGGLSDRGRKRLGTLMQHRHFESDEQIFSAGDMPRSIYLLNRGRADLVADYRSQMSSAGCPVGLDQLFGVTEVLSGHKFSMGLRAVTSCEFEVIERSDFVAFLHKQPEVCFRLAAVLSSLYQRTVTSLKLNKN